MKKKLLFASLLTFAVLLIVGCKKDDANNDVGGDETAIGQVGNEFWTSVSGVSDIECKVTKSENGVSTIEASGKLIDQNYKDIISMIPSFDFGTFDPQTGDFTVQCKMKFTNEGIVDYLNVAENPFVIGRYDAKVGDTYTYNSASGGTFTRTVTEKSDVDEFPYGWYDIKTMTIEEAGRNPAIKKIEYKINHRFGLVNVAITLQDGTTYDSNLYSVGEND